MHLYRRYISSILAISCFLFSIVGCSKPGDDTPPALSATTTNTVSINYVVVSATINNTGSISSKGFCWSKNPNPTLSDHSIVIAGSGNTFSDTITGLIYNTIYYVRAFATNSVGTSYSQQVQLRTQDTRYTIGQSHEGGKIFYIDSTGEHGFIYAPSYFYTHYRWAAWPHNSMAVGTPTLPDVGTGKSNTQIILASGNNAANTAAKVCDDFVLNGYSDWFLPSSHEVALLRAAIGPFDISGSLYWTSTEVNQYNAYLLPINATSSFGNDSKGNSWGVIPVRSF